mmetsp:Transcript_17902/g.60875  ORF Transcript_17902/g.60875 Transcript_17902/m.60875 type:complete len:231 (+) Transcript_17902:163-855(+)
MPVLRFPERRTTVTRLPTRLSGNRFQFVKSAFSGSSPMRASRPNRVSPTSISRRSSSRRSSAQSSTCDTSDRSAVLTAASASSMAALTATMTSCTTTVASARAETLSSREWIRSCSGVHFMRTNCPVRLMATGSISRSRCSMSCPCRSTASVATALRAASSSRKRCSFTSPGSCICLTRATAALKCVAHLSPTADTSRTRALASSRSTSAPSCTPATELHTTRTSSNTCS